MARDSEFASALKKGLGRAMILLRKAPLNPVFRTELMHACKANLVYDTQCELSRAPYLCNLINEVGDGRFYWDELLQAFVEAGEKDRGADRIQMFEVLCQLATENQELDRSVLRSRLLSADFGTIAQYCMKPLVRLEGLAGLTFCFRSFADQVGREQWPFRFLISELVERDGEEIAAALLRQARESDPELDRLMHEVETPEQSDGKIESTVDRETVRNRLANNQPVPYTWIQEARAEDLEWTADQLLSSTDNNLTCRYLRLFWKRDFPKLPADLVKLAHSDNDRVAHAAVRALSRIGHPEVRSLALELVSDGKRGADGILLLKSNWQHGDIALIERVLAAVGDDDFEFHNLGTSILEVFDHAPVSPAERERTLLELYERNPCSVCREEVVTKLLASERIPAWMAEECRYDAVPEITALFGRA